LNGKSNATFRLSLVGALKGPHLFDIVELIGKKKKQLAEFKSN
jgi:glutamyl-tRNA synthetase